MNRAIPLLVLVASLNAGRAAAQSPLREIAHDGGAWAVAFSPDGKTLASSGQDGNLCLTDLATGKEIRRFPVDGGAKGIAFAPDGALVAIKSAGGTLATYDVATGKQVRSLGAAQVWKQYTGAHLAFTADGKKVVACGVGERVVWQHSGGGASGSRMGKPPEGGYAAVAPDGSHTAWGYPTGLVQIYDTDGRRFQSQNVGAATALAFTPDGKGIVTAGADKVIRFWVLGAKQETRRLDGFDQAIERLELNRDGKVLAASAAGGAPSVRVWDVERGRPRRRLTGLPAAVHDIALSPDGKTLATADGDGKARLWNVALRDIERPKEFATLEDTELRRLWDELAGKDHEKAEAAYRRLAGAAEPALPFLRERLRKVAIPEVDFNQMDKLVSDLDAKSYAVRERAFAALAKYGELAEQRLRRVLANKPSPEAERRAGQLLERLKEPELTPDRLKALEGIELLEWLNSAGSRRVLEEIARDGLVSRLRTEAESALRRLTAQAGKS